MPKVLKIEEPETKSNWWVWILVIIGGLILFSIIKDKQQEADYENKMKQVVSRILCKLNVRSFPQSLLSKA